MGWSKLFKAVTLVAVLAFITCGSEVGAQDSTLITDIEALISIGEDAHPAFIQSLTERIQQNRAMVTEALLPRLEDRDIDERNISVYVWALGLTENRPAIDALIALCGDSKSRLVVANCLGALATIEDGGSGEYLMAALNEISDDYLRFLALDRLAQMKYEPALPETEEFLKMDYKTSPWEIKFIFGKYGDAAVPFLLQKLQDGNKNVRGNTIFLLGRWLMAAEAASALTDRYWVEKEEEFRAGILGSLELLIYDKGKYEAFFREVIEKEKKEIVKAFAEASLNGLDMITEIADSSGSMKDISQEVFQTQYDLLYESAGKDGDYELLAQASAVTDEPELKKLRERILQRSSDESFYDYEAVNSIIWINRFLAYNQQ
ncbi:MAG: hypothetical protein JSV52_15420 [Candidatus Zixiibacteriota bacterium]|nr:MAG: hypothetical protein JSV52_15420 [candidate division Zixibacteria bacterium]